MDNSRLAKINICEKKKLLTNFINKNDPIVKQEYRNLLSIVMKKSKQAIIMINIVKKNWNNIKNTWKGIKSPISLKTKASSVPTVLSHENGDTIPIPVVLLTPLIITLPL